MLVFKPFWVVSDNFFNFSLFLQILERQNKHQRNKNVDEKSEDSETEETGGLFDDWMKKTPLASTSALNLLTEDYSWGEREIPLTYICVTVTQFFFYVLARSRNFLTW